jgi:hypothetical protein
LKGTYDEPTSLASVRPGEPLMPEIVVDPSSARCYHCFPGLESKNLNSLLLIPFILARAARGCSISPATNLLQDRYKVADIEHAADRYCGLRMRPAADNL